MDVNYMRRAMELARKGKGFTRPNPLVGAVIVKDGMVIGEGYHEFYGGPHAEVNAFLNATSDCTNATMYVTLEPCSHHGKTPPCADLIIEKKIKKVVIGLLDPNPIVSGSGIKRLQAHGIETVVGVLENEIKVMNEIFIKFITTQKPYIIVKSAMTLDGKIATVTGDSKWITNDKSRAHVHELRNQVMGIMVGIDTVIKDNPKLTTRLNNGEGKDPIRIIVDSRARIPLDSNVINIDSNAKTILATTKHAKEDKIKALEKLNVEIITSPTKNNRVDLKYLIEELGKRKIDSILIEGGSTLAYSALEEGIVDKVYQFIAPKIVGGENAKTPFGGRGIECIKDSIKLQDITTQHFNEDVLIVGYIVKEIN